KCVVYWQCDIQMAVMKLRRGPLLPLQLLMILPLILLPDASQGTATNETQTLRSEFYPDSTLLSGETIQYETYNRPQRWAPQAEYHPVQSQLVQPHHQEQYMLTPNTGQPFQEDIVQPQKHALEYPNQNLIYQNQYQDSSGLSQNMDSQTFLQ
ncbi:unnamed protein product, partial [Meganyctiphanes norvegica]